MFTQYIPCVIIFPTQYIPCVVIFVIILLILLPPTPNKPGRVKRSKQLNLLRRLTKHQESIFAFLEDPQVPFDNNQAERDLRMMKTREKISGGFGSARRATDFCHLRSVISSARKQSLNILQTLTNLLSNPHHTGAIIAYPT